MQFCKNCKNRKKFLSKKRGNHKITLYNNSVGNYKNKKRGKTMEKTTKYILTIGLNDKDTKIQKYDTITAYKLIENVLQQYTEGYTIVQATGGYKHDNGEWVSEPSLRVELLFVNELTCRIIANKIKSPDLLNQESIAFEIIESNSALI